MSKHEFGHLRGGLVAGAGHARLSEPCVHLGGAFRGAIGAARAENDAMPCLGEAQREAAALLPGAAEHGDGERFRGLCDHGCITFVVAGRSVPTFATRRAGVWITGASGAASRRRAPAFRRSLGIKRRPLRRLATDRGDRGPPWRNGSSSWPWDAPAAREMLSFIKRATEIVGAGLQAGADAVEAHLHPRHLDVLDERVEREPRHRMHQHRLAERRPAARRALVIDRRLHVHERQRHELGEAAGAHLQVAHRHEMPRPMRRARPHGRT